jgi:hypothetical protein
MRALISGLALAGLTACGGGGDGGGGFTNTLNEFDALAQRLDALGYTTTPVLAIPSSGGPVYRGYALAGNEAEIYVGDLEMTAAFATSQIDGAITDIYDSAERPVAGFLVIDPTTIDRTADPFSEFQIVTTFGGTLTDADGVVMSIDGDLDGDFIGPSAEAVAMLLLGTASSTTYGLEPFDGVGLAAR